MVALRHEKVEDATNDKPHTADEQSYNIIENRHGFLHMHTQSKTPSTHEFNNIKYSPIHMTKIPAI
jgi:hypothetical protein